jgi:transcriptional regulator with XRE-family HTH domain
MQSQDHFQDFVSDPKRRRIYEREALAFEASELISGLMEDQKVSKTELAALTGSSKSHITQLLSGSRNMTMHTLADLAFVLGHKIELKSSPLAAVASSERCRPVLRGEGDRGSEPIPISEHRRASRTRQ